MSIQSINHVQLAFPAGAEAPIRRFYASLLGLPEVRLQAGNTLRFAAGTQRIDLVPTEHWQPAPAVSHLAFEVQDLPALRHIGHKADQRRWEQRPFEREIDGVRHRRYLQLSGGLCHGVMSCSLSGSRNSSWLPAGSLT